MPLLQVEVIGVAAPPDEVVDPGVARPGIAPTNVLTDVDEAEITRLWSNLTNLKVPIFVAERSADPKAEFVRPMGWQNLTADGNAERLPDWRPGMAGCAVTGGPLVVVDVDLQNGGNVDAIREWLTGLGVVIFAEIETPGGGAHFYVAGHPDIASGSRLPGWPGVDILSFNRNVFLPGTNRPKYGGRGYRVRFNDLDKLVEGGVEFGTEALADSLAEAKATRYVSDGPGDDVAPAWNGTTPISGREKAYLDSALRQAADRVAEAATGGRNHVLNAETYSLARLAAATGYPVDRITEAMVTACTSNGLVADDGIRSIRATIKSAIRGGMGKPRAVPEAKGIDAKVSALNADRRANGGTLGPIGPGVNGSVIESPSPMGDRDRLTPGGTFILDAPDHVPARWGAGDCVLWAEGEALCVVGPPGVGKTTLSGQIVGGLLGLLDTVLGMPVRPARRVLYLAMDRPRQIARALRRTLGHAGRERLDDRLIVWEGPPPSDIARHPEALLDLARKANADAVIVDSLKDAALGLIEDEVGAGYNRARQHCLANGIEVLELHHLVKRGPNGAKPTTLADVYGSTWITAGAGSVVLLWGAAGDPIVELVHLKQPAEPFGPCKIIHDHTAGTSAVWEGTDLEAVARAAGGKGITAKDAATVLFSTEKPSPAEVEKARRKLDKIPSLTRIDGSKVTNTATVWTFTHPSRSAPGRQGITDPSQPSRAEEFSQFSDHHGQPRDRHADHPSRTPPPLYRGGVTVVTTGEAENGAVDVVTLCPEDYCANVARPGATYCERHGAA